MTDADILMLKQDPVHFASERLSCSQLESLLLYWNMTALHAGDLYSRCLDSSAGVFVPRRIYFCIQMPKKMSPYFDPVMQQIMQRDPGSILVLSNRAHVSAPVLCRCRVLLCVLQAIIDRWDDEMRRHVDSRVFFLSRLPHLHHLVLLSMRYVCTHMKC